MIQLFATDNRAKLLDIVSIPTVAIGFKILGWTIPLAIIGSLALIAVQKCSEIADESAIYWILEHGIPASIGGLLSLAHPLTTLTAFAAAPITSLSPLIDAGSVLRLCASHGLSTCR
ncbi:MAG: hypothetical protein OEL83_10595 [Desulforhopalus sp.]|nr:hypothetical protein [Desulforhopalus sp.]